MRGHSPLPVSMPTQRPSEGDAGSRCARCLQHAGQGALLSLCGTQRVAFRQPGRRWPTDSATLQPRPSAYHLGSFGGGSADTPWIGKESVYCKAGVAGLGPVISIYQPQAAALCGARGRWRLAPGAGHRLANGEGGATVPPPPGRGCGGDWIAERFCNRRCHWALGQPAPW